MTPEEIKKEKLRLHTLLQPFYKERMDEWQIGDRYYDKKFKSCSIIHTVMAINYIEGRLAYYVRLPLPIDPVNPERGLWGMIDWDKYRIASYDNGECFIFTAPTDLSCYGWSSGRATPELALLRALAKQVGVE
jgi:hypothetical protein